MCPSDNSQNLLKDTAFFYIPRPKVVNSKENSLYHSCCRRSVLLDSYQILSYFVLIYALCFPPPDFCTVLSSGVFILSCPSH